MNECRSVRIAACTRTSPSVKQPRRGSCAPVLDAHEVLGDQAEDGVATAQDVSVDQDVRRRAERHRPRVGAAHRRDRAAGAVGVVLLERTVDAGAASRGFARHRSRRWRERRGVLGDGAPTPIVRAHVHRAGGQELDGGLAAEHLAARDRRVSSLAFESAPRASARAADGPRKSGFRAARAPRGPSRPRPGPRSRWHRVVAAEVGRAAGQQVVVRVQRAVDGSKSGNVMSVQKADARASR